MYQNLMTAAVVALQPMALLASDIDLIDPETLFVPDVDDFNDLGLGMSNHDGVFVRPGFSMAERFVGQGIEADFRWDVVTGLPDGPLTLQPGAPGENIAVFDAPEPWLLTVVAGIGPEGYPNFDGIGEGALTILFDEDQFEFGVEFEGVEFGCVTFDFYRRDATPIETIEICGAESKPYAFRRDGNVADIAGVVMTNKDDSGMAFDNIRFALDPCFADMNGDDVLNILDFVAFQDAFQAGDAAADCDGDGAFTVLDFVCFQARFAQGCD